MKSGKFYIKLLSLRKVFMTEVCVFSRITNWSTDGMQHSSNNYIISLYNQSPKVKELKRSKIVSLISTKRCVNFLKGH